MAKSVWAIEDGEYSDYHIVGVFSTRANAELVHAKMSGRGSIVEWPLNPAVAELRAGLKPFMVSMLYNGDVERCEATTPSEYDLSGSVRVWERATAPAYAGRGIPNILTATVWAKDETHAVKIVNEHRARMIASNEFTTGL